MRIIVDVMGGDNAPDAIALGAIEAAKEEKLDVVLVGRGEAILQCLKNHGIETLPAGVEIANADDVVDMHDDPAAVMKTRKNSSMLVGLQMLKDGGGDAFVSAGSTGALLTAATLIVKRIKGVRSAAMGPVLPTKTGGTVLIDCGATAECTPEFLLQFAFMGSYYAKKMLGVSNPAWRFSTSVRRTRRERSCKRCVRAAQKAGDAGYVNFIGNIEARGVPMGEADVVVSDGFSGNVLLKGIEGTALFMSGMMKDMFKKEHLYEACRRDVHVGHPGIQKQARLPADGRHGAHRADKAGREGARLVGRGRHPQRHPAGGAGRFRAALPTIFAQMWNR